MVKVSDYIFDFVARTGVRHVFMLPGGGAMHLNDSLGRNKELSYVCNLHEQACAIAADAYSQYTNNLGVALVTTGPGGTNAITGVAGAWLDSTPVLFISGQVKRNDMTGNRGVRQMGFQEIDIVSLVRPITKYAVTVMDPSSIAYHLEKAVYLARHGRPSPVWIDVPLDVQAAMIDESSLQGFDASELPQIADGKDLPEKVSRAVDLFNQAERPVILAGNGIRLSNGLEEFLRLIGELHIPVLTTWKAADFLPEDHPLYAGRPGAVGQRGANFTQQNADWLLMIGARMDLGQTAYTHANFARHARKIMVDIDGAEIQKMQMKIDVQVISDARAFLREFHRQAARVEDKDRLPWLKKCKEWQAKYPVALPEYWNDRGFVNDYVLMDVLSEELSGDDLLIPGSSGACSERTLQGFRIKQGQRIFNSQGFGSMGFGLPAAIGGCLASGKRRTVCIEGDGGFVMNIQELETVKRLALPIKIFILNNGGYGSIQATQKNYFGGRYVASTFSSGLSLPDVAAVSRAFGIPSERIADHAHIAEKVRQILKQEGPVACEVIVSPDQATAPRVSSRKLADGSMASMPMEDMWPPLDREELTANMLIPVGGSAWALGKQVPRHGVR
jgi:acetolactate synthase I/II/III large subunit